MRKILINCKQKAEVCLTRATESSSSELIVNAFCGQSKHTSKLLQNYISLKYITPLETLNFLNQL